MCTKTAKWIAASHSCSRQEAQAGTTGEVEDIWGSEERTNKHFREKVEKAYSFSAGRPCISGSLERNRTLDSTPQPVRLTGKISKRLGASREVGGNAELGGPS